MKKGSFTLPGEAGHEALTLRLAERWGADVLRDSDGTKLSPELTDAGYDIYSTICLIRSVNGWAKQNQDKLQQNLLMSLPVMAESDSVTVALMDGYSRDQFRVNDIDGMEFWQVFDRTIGEEVEAARWSYEEGRVYIRETCPYHQYTVNFFAYRLWEAISMYNHVTNDWGDRERLMPVEPRHPEARQAMLDWLEQWCEAHPDTNVVRFTSMFYNFAWIWSDNPKARDIYSDWGSYDFSVNPLALRAFREETGIDMRSEDFIHGGLRNASHTAPTAKYRQWMTFTHRFVADFGAQCVDVVHRHGKKAYVFYDDSWIGVEPYGDHFARFGFDGVIKCVFNGFEARLCAGVPQVDTHEIRLHPYLFPTGLKGEPTFAPGGKPTPDLLRYWIHIRRALLRKPVDRIGLGGYLHLVEPFEDFIDAVAGIADSFRGLKDIHEAGAPQALHGKVGILTEWGSLRTWSTSGHLHEHPEVDLLNVLEALSGLPVEVVFLSFDDLLSHGVPGDVSVLVNAGWKGSAWSGGDVWKDTGIVALLTEWVQRGGGFVGVREPSAVDGYASFALGHLLGMGYDDGSRKCMRKYAFEAEDNHYITVDGLRGLAPMENVYVDAPDTRVLAGQDVTPLLTVRQAGKGRAVYLSGYRFSVEAVRLMARAIAYAAREEAAMEALLCGNPLTECAIFDSCTVVVNNSEATQRTHVPGVNHEIELPPYGQTIIKR